MPTLPDSFPPRSQKPAARTYPPISASAAHAFATASEVLATVTTRKMAAVESGALTLCGSIGTRDQAELEIAGQSLP